MHFNIKNYLKTTLATLPKLPKNQNFPSKASSKSQARGSCETQAPTCRVTWP
jgi:hypothetical protein